MEKILFVDSYLPLLDLYIEEFTEEGYDVIVARNGKEALRKYMEKFPQLVVVDLHLPDMDGMELLNSFLSANPHVLIICYKDFPQEDLRTWGVAETIKSSNFSRLKNKVREVILN